MTCKVSRQEFLTALEAVSPGLSPKDVVEQSSCVIFHKGRLMTFNDEIACKIPFKTNGISGAVQGGKLLQVLRMMTEETVELEQGEGKLVISGTGQKVGVAMEAEVLLPVAKVESPDVWVKASEEYGEALMMAQECAGSDKDAFATTCVHFHPKWVEAFDNRQMLRYRIKSGASSSTLVKRGGVKLAAPIGVIEVAETPSWMHFKGQDGLVVSCRRFLETFADLGEHVASIEGDPIQLPKGLIAASDMAELFSSEDVDNNYIDVEIRPGKMRVKSHGASGWYRAVRDLSYSGRPLKFQIAPRMLKYIVSKHSEGVISPKYMKIDGGKWIYVACLRQTDNGED